MHIPLVTLVVRDYDDAISWFTRCLGFTLIEDTDQGNGKRWVVVTPPGAEGASGPGGAAVLLARAATPEQAAAVGHQTGGRVGFFLHTEDFNRDHGAMKACGVEFLEEPRHESYGTVVQFKDLYGNKWDLIGPRRSDQGT